MADSGKSNQHSSERQLNLFIALFTTRRYLTKAELRTLIEGYHSLSDSAFERQFERDKKDLTDLGIHIDVGSTDPLLDEKNGYRIHRENLELPEVMLSAEEAAVLGAVARVWDQSGRAAKTLAGLRKLEAGGVMTRTDGSFQIEPHLEDTEPSFDTVWEALRDREVLSFSYTDRDGATTQRLFECWSLFNHEGAWYVVGRDKDKDDVRVFRLSRMSDVRSDNKPASFDIPNDIDYRELALVMFDKEPAGNAIVHLRKNAGISLRRRASSITSVDNSWDELTIPYLWIETIASQLAGLGSSVRVIEPPEVKDATVLRLTLAGGHS